MKQNWVSSLKGFLIILVVLGHLPSPFTKLIYSFHMPAFFLISGFFINPQRNIRPFILNNLKKIFIYFLVFLIVGFVVEYLKRFILQRDQLVFRDFLQAIFYMDYNNLKGTYAYVLWFLPSLFVGKTIVFLVLKLSDSNFIRFIIIITFFLLGYSVDLPFSLDDGFVSTPFILLGFLFFENKNLFLKNYFSYASCILLLIIYFVNGIPDLNFSTKEFHSLFLSFFWIFSSFILLSKFCFGFTNSKNILNKLGDKSLLIFLLHPYSNNICVYISDHFLIRLLISFMILFISISYFQVFKNKISNV
jgi:acyltransferase